MRYLTANIARRRKSVYALPIVLAFSGACDSPVRQELPQNGTSATDGTISVESSSPYYAKLAAIDFGSSVVPLATVDSFRIRTESLERLCPDLPDHIGDMLVAGQHELKEGGKAVSLFRLTDDVVVMLTEAKKSGGIPAMKSCAEPIALMVSVRLAQQ